MKKRFLTWLLIAAMLLSIAFTLVSCSEPDEPEQSGEQTTAAPESEIDPNDFDDLGEVDLGGREVVIISRVESSNEDELFVEALNSEPVNDAVFNRNINVEERLKCEIRVVQHIGNAGAGLTDEVANEVSNMVAAGAKDYHIIANASYTSMSLAIQGRMCDLASSQYIDLDKNYWAQGYNNALSYKDTQYFVTGPMSLSYYRYMFVTLFNKQLMEDAGQQDSLYEIVDSGDWTIDYMQSVAELFYQDLNGSGSRDFDDKYGFCVRVGPHSSMMDGYWEGTDVKVLTKNEDGEYAYGLDGERISDSIEAVLTLLDSSGSFVGGEDDLDILKKFASDEVAMIHYRLIGVEDPVLRNMTNDYGILPMPKLNKEQDYKTHVQAEVLLYGVPSTCYEQMDDLSIFLEGFASESYNTVKPAYYEIALTGKYAKDPQSVEMLDRVVGSVDIDPINLYCRSFKFTAESIRTIHATGINTVSSLIRQYETSTRAMIEKLNENLQEVIDQNE